MLEQIENMSKNIGSLTLFLNNPKNIEYLIFLNSNILPNASSLKISEKVYYLLNDVKDPILCECGVHRSFIGFKNGYRSTCGKKECFVKKRKDTTIKRYGVDNPLKVEDIKLRVKNTNIKKYGASSPMKNDQVKNKFKKTMLDKHGVEWAQQSDSIKEKSRITWENNENKEEIILNRKSKNLNKSEEEKEVINNKKIQTISNKWGQHYMNNVNIKNKIKETFNNKYGFDSPFSTIEVSKKRIESYRNRTKKIIISLLNSDYSYIDHFYNKNKTGIVLRLVHNVCDSDFNINGGYFKTRIANSYELCLICNPILTGKSNRELEVLSFIEQNYNGKVLKNIKNIIKGELDIYLPEKNIAFEFNGLYWHSELYKEKEYHLSKTIECNKINIELIHIWEDDWDNKKDIVKSIILNKLNLTPSILFAKKCEIKEVADNLTIKEFLDKNHIHGFIDSVSKIGLFYNNELVSLMLFGSLIKNVASIGIDQNSVEGDFELLRFCNKLNTRVIGGSSKLFKYFIKNYSPNTIIGYSDLSSGNDNLYTKLGFNKEYETEPNYYWVIDGIRKKTEIMNNKDYYRIFDCGYVNFIIRF